MRRAGLEGKQCGRLRPVRRNEPDPVQAVRREDSHGWRELLALKGGDEESVGKGAVFDDIRHEAVKEFPSPSLI